MKAAEQFGGWFFFFGVVLFAALFPLIFRRALSRALIVSDYADEFCLPHRWFG